MKILILFVVCVAAANGQGADILQEMIGKAVTECKSQVQAKPEDMMELLQHKATATTPAKCLLACLAKRFKFMTATGQIDTNAARDSLKFAKFIGQDIYEKLTGVLDNCLGQVHVGDNECEVAYSFYICGINQADTALPKMMLGAK